MQHLLALSSSSRGGVRFALSSTQKVTISPFPFTVTFAKLDSHILCDQHFVIWSVYSVSVHFTLDNQVDRRYPPILQLMLVHLRGNLFQRETNVRMRWNWNITLPLSLTVYAAGSNAWRQSHLWFYESSDEQAKYIKAKYIESHLDCPWHMDCLLLPKAHHPRACVHCITKKAIPGQNQKYPLKLEQIG